MAGALRGAAPRRTASALAGRPKLPKGTSGSLKCSGCGAGLQSHAETGAGFLPRKAIERVVSARTAAQTDAVKRATSSNDPHGAAAAADGASHLICQRCYNSKHYGKLVPVEVDEETFREYIRAIR